MKLWVDAQISPALAPWIAHTFPEVQACSLKWLGLRDAEDKDVFMAARAERAVVMSKDVDFVELLVCLGPPPQIVWLTCGNTSNLALRALLLDKMPLLLELLGRGEALVEVK
jgi:predicted nuclease of predicted toxin-antitoxin system